MDKVTWAILATTEVRPDGTRWTKPALDRLAAQISAEGPTANVVPLCGGAYALQVRVEVDTVVLDVAAPHD